MELRSPARRLFMSHRKNFIGLLPLVFITLSGCFNWGSRAGGKLPDTTALQATYDYDGEVIVIGAGAAGLAAARVLEDNDVRYTVLEATERYGGRLGEDAGFADFPIDLGAEWIHNNPEILDVLSGEVGTAAGTPLIPYHLQDTYPWDGVDYTAVSQKQNDRVFAFFPEYKFKDSTWYSFVSEHFGQRVEHRIQYNDPVVSIDYSGERVEVTTAAGEVHSADKVLVTVSVGVLQSGAIAFVPGLSDDKQEAIDSVEFLPGIKLFLKFSEKFYPDAISWDVEEGQNGVYDVAFDKDASAHVLGLLATGPAADGYYALGSEEEMVSAVVEELDQIFDGAASDAFTGEYVLQDWGRHEYTKGTWVEGFKIRRATLRVLNESLQQKVYFAGEVNDPYHQMGVPAAVLSGLHAVDRLLTNQD
jgi:monoamine oxidase